MSKPSYQEPAQRAGNFKRKLGDFLKGSEDKLASIERQTESRRDGEGPGR